MCPIYYSRSDRDSNLVGSSGWRRHVGGGRARAYPEEQEPPPVRCARSADRGHVAPSRPHKQQALNVDRAGAFQVGRPTRQQPRLPSIPDWDPRRQKGAGGTNPSSKLFAACTIITCRCLHWVAFALIWADIMVLSVKDRVHARLGILLAGSPHLQHCTDKHGYRLLVSRRLN